MIDMNKYRRNRSARKEMRALAGKIRGGKLYPVMCVPFEGNESGMIDQRINLELEPIPGRLVTDIHARVTAVFVPALAADAMLNTAADYPGNAEVFRERLLAGEDVFPLEAETDLSKIMGVIPKQVSGTKYVSSIARVAHNSAVNYLRRRQYVKAAQILVGNTGVTPALITQNILDRFNGVLDPEDRVNGAVNLTGEIPIKGLGFRAATTGTTPVPYTMREPDGQTRSPVSFLVQDGGSTGALTELVVEEDPDNPGFPHIRADFALGTGQQLSMKEMYRAENMDRLARELRRVVDQFPQYGEDMIVRLVHGLQVDTGKIPFVLYEKEVSLGRGIKTGMDGPSLDLMQTNTFGDISFTVPVPANEFGGVVITFVEVKPDEVIESQPHPILTKSWGVNNHLSDEMALDPEPVTMRELDSEVDLADEGTIAFYVGHNHMRRNYVHAGWHRGVDPETVEHKSAMWRMSVPLSVDPGNIIYPEDLDHYPFALNAPTDNAVSYTIASQALIASPYKLGPTPIERLAIIDGEDLFEEGA